jgi:hypothetical protein
MNGSYDALAEAVGLSAPLLSGSGSTSTPYLLAMEKAPVSGLAAVRLITINRQ